MPLFFKSSGGNVLREPQVNVTNRLAGLVGEEHSVGGGLLDHIRVGSVTLRPGVGVFVVSVRDQAREVGLLVARGGIVQAQEGQGHAGEGDEETGLDLQSASDFSSCARATVVVIAQAKRTPKLSVPEEVLWAWPLPSLA